MENVQTQPLKAEVKTLVLEGKKLTKTIFRQIEIKDCFDGNMDFIGDSFFGYVKDGDLRFILWSYKGLLRKIGINPYINLREITDYSTTSKIEWFLDKCKIQYDADEARGYYRIEFDAKQLEKYNDLVLKVKAFLANIWENQIFI